MGVQLKTRIRSGYIIAFLLLLVSYFLIFYTIQRLVKGTRAVTHSYDIMNNLESMQALVTEMETNYRGYVINKQDRFLDQYNQALGKLPVVKQEIKQLTGPRYEMKAKVDSLFIVTDRRLRYSEIAIKQFQEAGLVMTHEMAVSRESGINAMDSVRLLINQLKGEERKVMEKRNATLSGAFTSTDVIAVTSLAIALLTVIYSLITYNRENKAKEEADDKAKVSQESMERNLMQLHKLNDELQALKQIEKFAATGRIARTIAHEVRNPLTNISLAAEQLSQNGPGDGNDQKMLYEMILRNTNRINQLVTDLLQSTRFAQLNFERVEFNQLVNETLDMAHDRIELNNITVKKDLMNGSHEVVVDREKIRLALLNIIVNAVEAMEKDKGVLTVVTSNSQGKCSVEIGDNGTGMDAEALQKIFDPYFTNKQTGTGLGLTNTQNIILNHKGVITVRSKPSEGTSFTVTLPQGDNPLLQRERSMQT